MHIQNILEVNKYIIKYLKSQLYFFRYNQNLKWK
jgi:hypothetical protein